MTTIGNGDLSYGGAVVETSGGVKYALFRESSSLNNLQVYKDIDGTPTLEADISGTTVFGTAGDIQWIHAAIDSNDDIHVLVSCATEQTRDVAYCVYDTGTDSFGTWEQAYDYTQQAPDSPSCSISLDSSDIPHIAIVDSVRQQGTTADNVYYANRVGGSWGNIQQIGARTTKTDIYSSPTITLRNNDDVEVVYNFATDQDTAYNTYTGGSWQGESVYTDTVVRIGVQGVTATSGGTVYRYASDNSVIEENGTSTSYSLIGTRTLSASLSGTDRYIFYKDSSSDVHLISNTGSGWTDEGALQTGTYLYIIAEWAYNNENQSGEINYIYDDGTDVYYDSFTVPVNTSDSTPAYLNGGAPPAIAFVNLGTSANPDISDGADLTVYTNSSWTPPTTGLIFCYVVGDPTNSGGPVTPKQEIPVMSGNNITWHHIYTQLTASTTGISLTLFAAFASGATTGVTTIDFRGRLQARCHASFFQVTGAYDTGHITDVFVQVVGGTGAAVTSGSLTLPSVAGAADRPIAGFAHDATEVTAPRTNWTEIDDLSASNALETQYRGDAFETTASASWATSSDWAGIAAEIREASVDGVDGYSQDYWQLREDDTAALNADDFDAAENTALSILMGEFARARIKVRRNIAGVTEPFKLQCRHETAAGRTGGWWDVCVLGNSITNNDTCVVGNLSSQYADGDPTSTELLTSTTTYVNGEGIEATPDTGNNITGSYDLDNQETEFEWLIQCVGSYSWPENEFPVAGGKIFLRVVLADGTAFPNVYDQAEITLAQNNGYIGMTMPELPRTVFWVDSNDKMYYLCEIAEWPTETWMMVSTDGGDTWAPVDRNNRPEDRDLEAASGVNAGSGLLKIATQMSDDPMFYEFNMSDAAANPDTWQNEQQIESGVTRDDQVASIVWRSDGTAIAFYEEAPSDINITYRIRSSGGAWGADNDLDSEASTNFTDVVAILSETGDLCHVFYVDNTNGKLYHNTISSGDSLGTREEIGTDVLGTTSDAANAIANVARYDSSGTDRIVVCWHDAADGHLYVSKVDDNGSPSTPVDITDQTVANNVVGSGTDSPVAKIFASGTDLYVIYAALSDGDLWVTSSADYGSWDTDVEIQTGTNATFFVGAVFSPAGGGTFIGYIYEKASYGGNGQGWYAEYDISGGTATSDNQLAWLAGGIEDLDQQPAWLAGGIEDLDNQIAWLAGGIEVSDAISAFLWTLVPDNIPAWLAGGIEDLDQSPAWLAGGIEDLDNQIAFLWGSMDDFDSVFAFLDSQADSLDSKFAFTVGSIDDLDNISAWLAGGIEDLDQTSAWLAGGIEVSDSTLAFLDAIERSSVPAFLAGGIVAFDGQLAYMNALDGAEDAQAAYLVGQDSDLDNVPAFIWGQINTLDAQSAFAAGQDTTSSSITAFTRGALHPVEATPAFLRGLLTDLDNIPAFMAVDAIDLDSTPAYMVAEDTDLSNIPAYTVGQASDVSSIPAWLAGGIEDLDQQPAFMWGSIDIADAVPAYLNGYSANASVTAAWLKGQDTDLDSTPAFTEGVERGAKPAFLAGGVVATDAIPGYLVGSSESSSAQSAFVWGALDDQDSTPAYTVGSSDEEISSTPAYTVGQDTGLSAISAFMVGDDDDLDSQAAFTAGVDTDLSSIPAFTIGWDTDLDNVPAYMRGQLTIQDSYSAYLNGQDTASGTTPAFTEGVERSSIPAFIDGLGPAVSSIPVFAVGQDTDLSSVPAWLVGSQPISVAQPAWLNGESSQTSNIASFAQGWAHVETSQDAFLSAIDSTLSSQPAYLAGSSELQSSNPAFLVGSIDAKDGQAAWTVGWATTSSSQSVFMECIAGIFARSSISAFIPGAQADYSLEGSHVLVYNLNGSFIRTHKMSGSFIDDYDLWGATE
jgi:hypothetical protein